MRVAILGCLFFVTALPAPQVLAQADSANTEAAADAEVSALPRRVIIEVGRHETAYGTVTLDDEQTIVIRNRRGQAQSFPKARILRIIELVDPEPGQMGVVIMRDGSLRQGTVIEDTFDQVLLEVEGIRARLLRETVDHVVLQPTFEQTYTQFKRALMPNRPEQHLELCRWLFQMRKYELCKQEIEALLEEAELAEARRLMRLVDAQLALEQDAPRSDTPPRTNTSQLGDEGDLEAPRDILTHDDVNLIRVYELDFDHPPRVMLEQSTIQKLIENYSDNKLIPASRTERNALFNAEPIDIVEHLIFELRARELYPEIKVITEPYSLNLFRLRVHNTWLMNNCASTECHGGTNGGRLFLYRRGYRDARVRYTNFLILERLKLDTDKPPLIDYDNPLQSLVIQYGMPRDEARYPHPDVPNWQPAFPPGNSKAVDYSVEWIQSMMQPRPEYPIEFQPPDPKAKAEESPAAGDQPALTDPPPDERPGRVPR